MRPLISSVSTYHVSCRPWAGVSALASSLSSFLASPALIFPSFFPLPPDCHSYILSRPLCFAPLPTVYLYTPLPTPHLMSGHGMQPRLQAWPPYGLTVRTFQAKQMFRIQPNITLDPCATMNYSLCFSLAGRARDGMRGLG